MDSKKIIRVTELLGDGIGTELMESVHTVAEALPLDFEFIPINMTLEARESGNRDIFSDAAAQMRETRVSMKYPTVTQTVSPNAIIRRLCNFSVILRPVISIKGIKSNFKEQVFLYIVRIATGGTYDDPGRLVGRDAAISIRIVEREPCTNAARFAFELARQKNLHVTSSSKHTIQRATDGLFEAIVDEVHKEYKDVPHNLELFDALLAKLIMNPEKFQIVLVLNEYGDFLSDMASGLAGSIGTGASGNFSFLADGSIDVAMFDASGGTAPDIAGQDKCNPTGILLSFGMLLDHLDHYDIGHAMRLALLEAVAEGKCPADIGGDLGTKAFVQQIIEYIPKYLP